MQMQTQRASVTSTRARDSMSTSTLTQVSQNLPTIQLIQLITRIITGITVGLLMMRFLIVLFGAARTTDVTSFIVTFTQPLTLPFRSMSENAASFGSASFEIGTLMTIIIYTLLGTSIIWLLEQLIAR